MSALMASSEKSKSKFDVKFGIIYRFEIGGNVSTIGDPNSNCQLCSCDTYEDAFSSLQKFVGEYDKFLKTQHQSPNREYIIEFDGSPVMRWNTVTRTGVINEMVY